MVSLLLSAILPTLSRMSLLNRTSTSRVSAVDSQASCRSSSESARTGSQRAFRPARAPRPQRCNAAHGSHSQGPGAGERVKEVQWSAWPESSNSRACLRPCPSTRLARQCWPGSALQARRACRKCGSRDCSRARRLWGREGTASPAPASRCNRLERRPIAAISLADKFAGNDTEPHWPGGNPSCLKRIFPTGDYGSWSPVRTD
ncbi:hypothetical protein HNP60_000395 [Sphingobium sp. B1D3A]|uniref:Uncharacterized protein n=1 Tax=Sphingobium lignivorans TaxID=2735886 RepID=A0ABR6NAW5_9SPHN|nr:hypothetical protein [Sphingobium lignivorans]